MPWTRLEDGFDIANMSLGGRPKSREPRKPGFGDGGCG